MDKIVPGDPARVRHGSLFFTEEGNCNDRNDTMWGPRHTLVLVIRESTRTGDEALCLTPLGALFLPTWALR